MNQSIVKIVFAGCLILSLGLLFLAGVAAKEGASGSIFLVFLSLIALVIALVVLGGLLYEFGLGKVAEDSFNLPVNEVYETLSVVEIVDALNAYYVAVLKDRRGRILAYKLKSYPPKCFKKTDDINNPYVAYPQFDEKQKGH